MQPEAVLLTTAPDGRGPEVAPIDLMHLAGVDLRHADDGWHAVWQIGDITHQFWLSDAPPEVVALYTVTLPFDALFELRAHAARRLWRALNGRRPGPVFRSMPDQLRQFHILTLRALDARLLGESYRKIAEILLGFHGNKTDWESDPRKNKARRLVAAGKHLMHGGYRVLLHYPIKLPRR